MLFTCFTANPITNVLLYFMLFSAPGEGGEWCRFGRGGVGSRCHSWEVLVGNGLWPVNAASSHPSRPVMAIFTRIGVLYLGNVFFQRMQFLLC